MATLRRISNKMKQLNGMNQEEITQKKLALGCEKMLNNSAVSIDQQLKKMLASSN